MTSKGVVYDRAEVFEAQKHRLSEGQRAMLRQQELFNHNTEKQRKYNLMERDRDSVADLDYESNSIDASDVDGTRIGTEDLDRAAAADIADYGIHSHEITHEDGGIFEEIRGNDRIDKLGTTATTFADRTGLGTAGHNNTTSVGGQHDSVSSSLEYQHPRSGSIKGILMLLVFLHLIGLMIWLRAWLKDRRTKTNVLRKTQPPPLKQSCTYDMDRAFAISKVELPLKALKLAKS